jgi:hypothetical protein
VVEESEQSCALIGSRHFVSRPEFRHAPNATRSSPIGSDVIYGGPRLTSELHHLFVQSTRTRGDDLWEGEGRRRWGDLVNR